MNNAVILNKDASTWPRIKKYWEDRGVDTGAYKGKSFGNYYGIVDGTFGAWGFDYAVRIHKAEIIELPEENERNCQNGCDWPNCTLPKCVVKHGDNIPDQPKEEKKYPRVMWVWNNLDEEGLAWKRKVICKAENKFITVEFGQSYSYNYAKDILPEIEVTLEEIAAWKGVSVEQVKIKNHGK